MNPLEVSKVIIRKQQTLDDSQSIIVAFSGGKDSIVTMDLCHSFYKKVTPFYLYFTPGLNIDKYKIEMCKKLWGVDLLMYPHPIVSFYAKNGFYCTAKDDYFKVPKIKQNQVFDRVRRDVGVPWMALGWRQSDSLQRRLTLRNYTAQGISEVSKKIYPISLFKKKDVLSYLDVKRIPTPPSLTSKARNSTGVGLSPDFIKWIYNYDREDYEKIRYYFPHVDIILKQEEMYYGSDTIRKV